MKYAFIKATEGTGFVDKKLRENATQAHENGIKVSYYHFAHPDPTGSGKSFSYHYTRATP
ncbi:hypothetical protein C2W64_02410 [Brevibacillus laterosporus]|nr:hypothetical protein C2W64_02410 [Brevibacillus laterosporus]